MPQQSAAAGGEVAPQQSAAAGEVAQQQTTPDSGALQQSATPAQTPQQDAVPAQTPQQGAVPTQIPQQGAVPGEEPPSQLPAEPGFLQRGRMRRRARFLRAARELAYRDLGGLVFDLHRFGARNDEVVAAKLETLRRIDEELRALEGALNERTPITVLREVGVAACPRCAAIHGSGDRFCPACGMAVAPSERPIGGAPAHPPASPAVHQHAQSHQQPIHAYQPPSPPAPPAPPAPPVAPITQPHNIVPPLPPIAPSSPPAQSPPPLPHAAAPAAAQQIGNGAYPALPAAPAAPTSQTPSAPASNLPAAHPTGEPHHTLPHPAATQQAAPHSSPGQPTAPHPTAPQPTAPQSATPRQAAPQPVGEVPTEILSSHDEGMRASDDESTRAFEPIPPAPSEQSGRSDDRDERRGE